MSADPLSMDGDSFPVLGQRFVRIASNPADSGNRSSAINRAAAPGTVRWEKACPERVFDRDSNSIESGMICVAIIPVRCRTIDPERILPGDKLLVPVAGICDPVMAAIDMCGKGPEPSPITDRQSVIPSVPLGKRAQVFLEVIDRLPAIVCSLNEILELAPWVRLRLPHSNISLPVEWTDFAMEHGFGKAIILMPAPDR